jgi:tetratricopeptide (TPR) repeat protein
MLVLTLALSALLTAPPPAAGCASKTTAGEDKLKDNDLDAAEPLLVEAVALCNAARAASARPFIALGTLYFRTQRWALAIPQFYEGLEREPDLPLAYMNLSAAHQQLKQFDKSVKTGTKAIELAKKTGDRQVEAKANFNVGLALFSDAAAKSALKDLRSQPFFEASRDVDPSFGGNYFYLGIIAQVMHRDVPRARKLLTRGCELKYGPACNAVDKLPAQ